MWNNGWRSVLKGNRCRIKMKWRVSDALCSWTAACLQRRRTRHSRIIQKRHSAAPCRFYDDNISTVRHSCFYSFRRFEDKISSCGAENREYGMISWKIERKNHFIFSTRASFDIITPIWYWRVVYGFDIYFVHFSTLLGFLLEYFFFFDVKLTCSSSVILCFAFYWITMI